MEAKGAPRAADTHTYSHAAGIPNYVRILIKINVHTSTERIAVLFPASSNFISVIGDLCSRKGAIGGPRRSADWGRGGASSPRRMSAPGLRGTMT